jgi:DNA modification methylase
MTRSNTQTRKAPRRKPAASLSHIAEQLRKHAVAIDALVQDPRNARSHDERNIEAIKSSLLRFGQVRPIVVAADGETVLAGNGTLEAARQLGWGQIAAVTTRLEGHEAMSYSVADNRTAELAAWDDQALLEVLTMLRQADGESFEVAGFTPDELAELEASVASLLAGDTETPEPLEPPDDPVTRRGDLWLLGDHRLLCGDSSHEADVDRLVGAAKIQLVNTDPPYNVRVEPRSNNAIAAGNSSFAAPKGKHHQQAALTRHPEKAKATHRKMRPKDAPLVNDFVSDEQFDQLLLAWFGQIARVLLPGRSFYIWGGYANCGNYPPVLKACGLYFSQAIIWNKMHPVLTRKDYMGAHEWCFYGWLEGGPHKFFGPSNVPDVWSVKKVNPQSMVHLTEKPVELAVRAIQYSSRPGENVLDLFGGSGSTLIAAEQVDRQAFLMEIDPAYCDVIVGRWEEFTGQKAKRIAAVSEVREKAPTSVEAGDEAGG